MSSTKELKFLIVLFPAKLGCAGRGFADTALGPQLIETLG